MPFDAVNFAPATKIAPPVVDNEVQRVLREAKEIMRRRGWGQGTRLDKKTGKVCLKGAVALALTGEPTSDVPDEYLKPLQRAASIVTGRKVHLIWWFNDKQDTARPVYQALDLAITLAGQKK